MTKDKDTLPTIITEIPLYLKIVDSEPLENATDPSSNYRVTFECQLTQTSSNPPAYDVSASVSSYYYNDMEITYNSSDNTLYFELNDAGAGNGSTFTRSSNFTPSGNSTFVYAKVKKGTSSAGGTQKHKIAYGTEKE